MTQTPKVRARDCKGGKGGGGGSTNAPSPTDKRSGGGRGNNPQALAAQPGRRCAHRSAARIRSPIVYPATCTSRSPLVRDEPRIDRFRTYLNEHA